jgi:hypothetical protein
MRDRADAAKLAVLLVLCAASVAGLIRFAALPWYAQAAAAMAAVLACAAFSFTLGDRLVERIFVPEAQRRPPSWAERKDRAAGANFVAILMMLGGAVAAWFGLVATRWYWHACGLLAIMAVVGFLGEHVVSRWINGLFPPDERRE